MPDHDTPIDETLDAVAELLEEKKIRAWGVSNYAAWQVLEMIHKARRAEDAAARSSRSSSTTCSSASSTSSTSRFARRYALHTTVYNPLAGGLLSGKHARDGSTQRGSRFDKNRLYQGRYFTDAMFDRVEALADLARAEKHELGRALVRVARGRARRRLHPARARRP